MSTSKCSTRCWIVLSSLLSLCGSASGQVVLDGNLSDFKALLNDPPLGHVVVWALDTKFDPGNPGADGFQDEPIAAASNPNARLQHSPINIGDFYVVYKPDTDGDLSFDDSFIAFGVNICNGDFSAVAGRKDAFAAAPKLLTPPDLPDETALKPVPHVMVPFDADGDGDPSRTFTTNPENRWGPLNQPLFSENNTTEDYEVDLFVCLPDNIPFENAIADLIFAQSQRSTFNTEIIARNRFGDNLTGVTVFPPTGSTTTEIRDRGRDGIKAFPDGFGNDDVEFLVAEIDSKVAIVFPGETFEQRVSRMFNLAVQLRGGSTSGDGTEDFARVSVHVPEIEVFKEVRCVGGDGIWRRSVDALPDSTVEFRITVKNTGSLDLAVDLQDKIQAVLPATLTPINGTLQVKLFRPSDTGGAGQTIDFSNAGGFNFNPAFFGASGNQFLVDVVNGTRRCLGVLLGSTCIDDNGDDITEVILGDRVEVTFQAKVCVGPANDCLRDDETFCNGPKFLIDGLNSVSAFGDPIAAGKGPCADDANAADDVFDIARDTDTRLEIPKAITIVDGGNGVSESTAGGDDIQVVVNGQLLTAGGIVILPGPNGVIDSVAGGDDFISGDDNEAFVNLICRNVAFVKDVGLDCNFDGTCDLGGVDADFDASVDVPQDPSCFPLAIVYRYTVTNTGTEIPETVTITDQFLCNDVQNCSPGVSFPDGCCELCETGGGSKTIVVGPGETQSIYCWVRIETIDDLTCFLSQDEEPGHGSCQQTPEGGGAGLGRDFQSLGGGSTKDGDPNGGPAGDPNCYANCARATATPNASGDVCGAGSTLQFDSVAVVCRELCPLTVEKKVQCLTNCDTGRTTVGGLLDSLDIVPGAAFRFVVTITHIGGSPQASVRVTDLLPVFSPIVGSAVVQFTPNGGSAINCPAAAAKVRADGTPFTIDLAADCATGPMVAGDKITITFDVCSPCDTAPQTVTNTVVVEGDAQGGCPCFTPCDAEDASVVVKRLGITCTKAWIEYASDVNGNCLTDDAFVAITNAQTDLLSKNFPMVLKLRVRATNTGEVALTTTVDDDALQADVAALAPCVTFDINGDGTIQTSECEFQTVAKCVPAGGFRDFICQVKILTAEAARQLADLDGNTTGDCYDNLATVSGVPNGDTNCDGTNSEQVCIPTPYNCPAQTSTCGTTVCFPPPCALTVVKDVKCAEDSDAAYTEKVNALPGSLVRFRIRVANAGTVPIPRVCITDILDPACRPWLVANSTNATIAATTVTNCVRTAFETGLNNGTEQCFTFAACSKPLGIGVGETLTITFDLRVPANFNTKGVDPDCVNSVSVAGYTEACANPGGCGIQETCDAGPDTAAINVVIPSIACTKEVGFDGNGDGDVNGGAADGDRDFSDDLDITGVSFSATSQLIYRFSVTNDGEVNLINAQVCDNELVKDAIAAGSNVTVCDLCTGSCASGGNDLCASIGSLAIAASQQKFCRIPIANINQFVLFAAQDGQDAGCENAYTNNSTSSGEADGSTVCDQGATRTVSNPCDCTVRLSNCNIQVIKEVRCLDNCTSPGNNETGWVNADTDGDCTFDTAESWLKASPAACLEYRIRIINLCTEAEGTIRSLRITDTLSEKAQFASVPFNVRVFSIGGAAPCATIPANFNVDGVPFTCDGTFGPGQELRILFQATLKNPGVVDPSKSPCNHVIVEAAVDTTPPFDYTCLDEDTEGVDILPLGLTCTKKIKRIAWDKDADCSTACEANEFENVNASTFTFTDQVFPVCIEYETCVTNTGLINLNVTVTDPELEFCVPGFDPCVKFESSELGVSKPVAPGATVCWIYRIRIETLECALLFADCDGSAGDGCFISEASAAGEMAGTTGVCVPPSPPGTDVGTTCEATVCFPPPGCNLEVDKKVRCKDEPASECAESVLAQPGDKVTFCITITNGNTATDKKIPKICVTDTMSCAGWSIVPGSIVAKLGATTVSSEFASLNMNGVKTCHDFSTRSAEPYIKKGEVLTIEFDAIVPAGTTGVCRNTFTVEGYLDVCAGSGTCDTDSDTADVLMAEGGALDCTKIVKIDAGNNGSIEDQGEEVAVYTFPAAVTFSITATNVGPVTVADVCIKDPELISDATNAGITILNSDFDRDANCAAAGTVAFFAGDLDPGQFATAEVTLLFNTSSEFLDFAGRDADGDENCYINNATITGNAGGCTAGAVTVGCSARVCAPNCPPIVQVRYDVWNQNEVKFTGMRNCILSWDERLVSTISSPNYFLRTLLQTNAGKARIDGIKGSACGNDPNQNFAAPLIGVAFRIIDFTNGGIDRSGAHLVGEGEEVGCINATGPSCFPNNGPNQPDNADDKLVGGDGGVHTGPDGAAGTPPGMGNDNNVLDNPSPAAHFKGSFVIFPKVELKWADVNGDGTINFQTELIQDVFISLVNDRAGDVRLKMYFVNGDPLECNSVDFATELTAEQPAYWSVFTGRPGPDFPNTPVTSFTILDPDGIPDPDPKNPGGRHLHGYILAWITDSQEREIRWNHLSGKSLTVNYAEQSTWEADAWAFQAVASTEGNLLLPPYGHLDFNGIEYNYAPALLLMHFIATTNTASDPLGIDELDTDLTLFALKKDLENSINLGEFLDKTPTSTKTDQSTPSEPKKSP
ncbi:MAG: hypothetical protein CHACPFDD_02634 [Phycisphaerae bacterium]|nr:hypothetical protein [Phycisphaerae bacterium]